MKPMPVIFYGHGSPMNAIEDNAFTRAIADSRKEIPQPKGILVVSAHWETRGTKVLRHPRPVTIHDFRGFPPELHRVQYPAPGATDIASALPRLEATDQWGFDHGTWSILCKLYPEARIPVTQLSLDRGKTLAEHAEFARSLRDLREQGVLVLGSGNIVHNLRVLDWRDPNAPAQEWAAEFDDQVKVALLAKDVDRLVELGGSDATSARLSVPTPEHFLPLIYVTALMNENDQVSFPVEGMQHATISMRSVKAAA